MAARTNSTIIAKIIGASGIIGGICFSTSGVPQMIDSVISGNARGISAGTLWLWLGGEFSMTIFTFGSLKNGDMKARAAFILLANYLFCFITVGIIAWCQLLMGRACRLIQKSIGILNKHSCQISINTFQDSMYRSTERCSLIRCCWDDCERKPVKWFRYIGGTCTFRMSFCEMHCHIHGNAHPSRELTREEAAMKAALE